MTQNSGAASVRPLSAEPPLSPPVSGPAPQPTLRTANPAPLPAPSLEALLLRFKLVNPDQMSEAMREESISRKPVAEIVVERGWVSQENLERVMAAMGGGAPPPPASAAPAPAPPEPAPAVEPPAVVVAETPPSPPVAEPPRPEPEPAPEPDLPPAAELPAPPPVAAVPAPAPVAAAPEPPAPAFAPPPAAEIRVIVRLIGGDEVVAGVYADAATARARAQELVEAVQRQDAWTFVGGKPLEPQRIDSIYLG
jgi:hypothetical protein